jgi:Rod binding domain-containing protein
MEITGMSGGMMDAMAESARNQGLQANLERLKERTGDAEGNEKTLRQVSRDLESLFVKLLMDSMDKTIPRGEDSWDNSQEMQTWRGMMNETLSGQLSENSPIGLADMIYRQLSGDLERHKDVPSAPDAPSAPTLDVDKAAPAAPCEPPRDVQSSGSGGNSTTDKVLSYRELIEKTAAEEGVDPALVAAMIAQESGGDPEAVSSAGARGLMQLMPATARMLGVENTFDPHQNVAGGVNYISRLLERYGGDEKLALAAYNAGPGNVDRYGGVPPYRETNHYLQRVSRFKQMFSGLGLGSGV